MGAPGSGVRGPGAPNLAGDGLTVGGAVVGVATGVEGAAAPAVADGDVEACGDAGWFVGATVRRGAGTGVTTGAATGVGIGVGVGVAAGFATTTFAGLTLVSLAWRSPAPLPLEASKR